MKRFTNHLAIVLGCVAAVSYCSWPLGLLLNHHVAAQQLASNLQVPGQPYYQVFVVTDIIAAILLIAAVLLLWQRLTSKLHRTTAVTLGISSLLIAGAALTPLDCDPATPSCGRLIEHPAVLVHGFCSIASVIALFIALGSGYLLARRQQRGRTLGIILITGWLVSGVGTLVETFLSIKGNTWQYYFITLCSLTMLYVVALLTQSTTTERQVAAESESRN